MAANLRLQLSADVRAALTSGLVAHGRVMAVHARDRGERDPARWTVVAGRKVGGAVQRNRAKRRLRATVQLVELPAGLDVVVVARQRALVAPFEELCSELERLLMRLAQRAGAAA